MSTSSNNRLRGVRTKENLILLVIDGFAKRGLNRVRQYELHKAVWRVASQLGLDMRFITSPTIYSDDLDTLLHKLERKGLINELLIVHDGWVPKRVYEMTFIGKIVSAEIAEQFSQESKLALEKTVQVLES